MPRRRRVWLFVGAVPFVLLGVGYLSVWLFTREPPNYAEVEPGLYVGGHVNDPPWFTHATLNLCEVEDSFHTPAHEWRPIRDTAPTPNLDWLAERVAFIEEHRTRNKTVFVHCMNGASRSVTVVTAYLMKAHGWSREKALSFVRTRRPQARPNPAFIDLLAEWEHRLAQERR